MSSSPGPPNLLDLPNELLSATCRQLPNRDIKSLRLSCSRLCAVALLRLNRVFLSANPRNVDVFNAIAAHEVFRHQVTEIIWDDGLLDEGDTTTEDDISFASTDEQFYEGPTEDEDDWDPDARAHFPHWFGKACKEGLFDTIAANLVQREMPDWTRRPMLPISECWIHYQKLLQQQRDVLESNAHVSALEDAWRLRRFPAVRTITITPAAHGRLFYPLFETPMIRALPPGFNYPLPRGWPMSVEIMHEAEEWDDEGNDWPGFRIVTSIVAQHPYDLAELRVDSFQLPAGLNVRVFEEPCRALQDFATIVTRSSFHHLHLDLLVGGQQHYGWAAFTRGHLAHILSEARLESLSIRTDTEGHFRSGHPEHHVPLRTVFKPAILSHLRHFSLSGFHVREGELLEVLADLQPELLQTVELSFLALLNEEGDRHKVSNFRRLLERMREELQWRDVKVSIGEHANGFIYGRAIWVDVGDFLYRSGENPFSEHHPGNIACGFGIEKDLFDLEFERPYLNDDEMKALGYHDRGDELDSIVCRR